MERTINLGEENLQTDIRDLSQEIVHDLFLVCRKAGIYAIDHPMVINGISKPYMELQRLFGFKKYFTLMLDEGRLYANNILMTDAGAVNYLKEKMHDLDLESVIFDEDISAADFTAFVERLVTNIGPIHSDYFVANFLERRRINTIYINNDFAKKLFNTGLRYREVQYNEFSVRRLVSNYFSGDIELAVTALTEQFEDTEIQAAETGIDYHQEIVKYILPEKFSELPSSNFIAMAELILDNNPSLDEAAIDKLSRLISSFDYHAQRSKLMEEIKSKFIERGIDDKTQKQIMYAPTTGKMDANYEIDKVIDKIFSEQFDYSIYGNFHDAFIRLIRTRQTGKMASITEFVVNSLSADSSRHRQHAIYLVKDIITASLSNGEVDFLDTVLHFLKTQFTQGLEVFEFSEVVVTLIRSMILLNKYKAVAGFLGILSSGRHYDKNIVTYDSVTVRKIFEDLNNAELISRMVVEIKRPQNNQIKYIREILIAIQSEEVALQMAKIVAHSNRQIRQHSLKILSELGSPAVKIFSDIIKDDEYFTRAEDRRELPDEKWYLIRNSIFVLGNLKDTEACHAFRFRLSDPDVRVRIEMVRALEKIASDNAIDMLMILAEDPDASVREMAIITLGLFKRNELLQFFTDIILRQKGETIRLINAIAQLDSPEAHKYLISLLEDPEKIKNLSSGKASISDIQSTIIKNLKKSGNKESLEVLKNFQGEQQGNLTKTAKILLSKFTGN